MSLNDNKISHLTHSWSRVTIRPVEYLNRPLYFIPNDVFPIPLHPSSISKALVLLHKAQVRIYLLKVSLCVSDKNLRKNSKNLWVILIKTSHGFVESETLNLFS